MAGNKLVVKAKSDREVEMTRAFDAPRRLVFDAHTKPELVRRWLLGPPGWSMPVCEIDLRVGGKYRYVWRNADGRDMALAGIYREIAAPERLVSTETFDDDWTAGETTARTEFTERQGRTTVTTTVLYSSTKARDGAMATGMADGMEAGYARLDDLLASLSANPTAA
jgi:uncharacterized protein YndB with AHSA1/START domain